MGQGITIDVSARIVGYLESLKLLQQALSKVDPGSDIGKSLSKAFTNALQQVKELSKNMFPKAGNELLVDKILGDVDRVGMALDNVRTMFSGVSLQDLKLDGLTTEISSAIREINTLLNSVTTTMNAGIRDAVSNSTELKSLFTSLGKDITQLTPESGSMALSEGLAAARLEAETASLALLKATNKVNELLELLNNKKANSPFNPDSFNLNSFKEQLNLATPERMFNKDAFSHFYDSMLALTDTSKLSDGIKELLKGSIENSFNALKDGATVSLFRLAFGDLYLQMTNQFLLSDNLASRLFGGTIDPDKLIDQLFGIDSLALKDAKNLITNMLAPFREQFNQKENNKIDKLIDEGLLEKATEAAILAITRAHDKVEKAFTTALQGVNDAKEKLQEANNNFIQANLKVESFDKGSANYNLIVSSLMSTVASLTTKIALLEATVLQLTNTELGKVLQGGGNNPTAGLKPAIADALKYKNELNLINSAQTAIGKMLSITLRWFSVYAAVRGVTKAIRSTINTTKELDATITDIAIVTNMSQDLLWSLMPQYTEMARQYGASISGVYKVSQLYYQQGLKQNDVMALSAETLKMARISGLDYGLATDYMTNAVRSFKMEMTDALVVTDVYSAVAAKSATSVTEIATAMSKTASSALAVGSSIQNTTAMMAVMIEATRESPENIGSAMKSIISRYGELKENKTGIDEEGEEYSLNKVDKALLSVGLSIHDALGQFRNFDDVIMELAESWDTIDTNTQRYIATVMAGNRQQSRFLALVSSYQRLKELSAEAADSEDASQMQFLKTIDSIEYKSQLLLTSLQSLYTDSGILNLIKDALDGANNIIQTFTSMPKTFDMPLAAIAKFGILFANIAKIVTTTFGLVKTGIASLIDAIRLRGINSALLAANLETSIYEQAALREITIALRKAEAKKLAAAGELSNLEIILAVDKKYPLMPTSKFKELLQQLLASKGSKIKNWFGNGRGTALAGLGFSLAGSALTMGAMSMGENTQVERNNKALMTALGSAATGAGMGSMFGIPGMIIGGLVGTVSGLILAADIANEDAEEKTARLQKELEAAKNENISKKNEYKTLKNTISEYERLKDAHLENADAAQEYLDKCNEIAEEHPDLISGYDAEGNAIVNLSEAYKKLKLAKEDVSDSEKKEADALIDAAANAVKNAEAAHAAALTDEAIFESGEGEDVAERKAELLGIANTILTAGDMSLQYSTGIRETLSAFMTGNFGKAKELIKTNAEDFKLEQKLNGEDSPLSPFFSLVDTVSTLVEDIESNLTSSNDLVKKAAGELKKAEAAQSAKYKIGAKSVVDSEIQELLLEDEINNTSTSSYLSLFKNASTLMTRSIAKKAEKFKSENPEGKYFEDGEFDKDFDKVNKELADFSRELGPKALNRLDEYIANLGNYTLKESDRMLEELFLGMDSPELIAAVRSYYDNVLVSPKDIIDSVDTMKKSGRDSESIGDILKEREATLDQLGANELLAVSSFYNNIVDAVNDKSITADTAKLITGTYMDLWNAATTKLADKNKSDKVLALIKDSDFTSNEGIEKFLTGLSDLGVSLNLLELDEGIFKDIQFPENFSGRVQAFANQTINSMTNFDKDLGNATKGMDFGEASKLASKLGMDLTLFRREGTKFFLDDYNAIKDYYFKDYNKDLADLLASLEKELSRLSEYKDTKKGNDLNNIADGFKRYKDNELELNENLDKMFDTSDEGNKDFIGSLTQANITPKQLKNLIADYIKNGKEGETFLEYMKDHFQLEYDAYAGAANDALLHSINESYLLNGNLDAFVDSITSEGKEEIDYTPYIEEARKNLKELKIAAAKESGEAIRTSASEGGLSSILTLEEVENEAKRLAEADAAAAKEEEKRQLKEALKSGDITKLTGKLAEYSKDILDTYKSVNSSITNALFDAMEGGEELFVLDEKNRETMADLANKHRNWFLMPTGKTINNADYVTLLVDEIMKDEEGFKEFIDSQTLTRKERAEYMKKWHDIHYPDPQDIASKMMTSSDYLSYDASLDLYAALKEGTETETDFYARMGIEMTNAGGRITDRVKYIQALNDLIAKILDPELRRLLEAELASAERLRSTLSKLDTQKAVEDLLKDTDEISEDSRKALESAIGVDEAKKYFSDNKDGTHKLNVRELRQDIESGYLDIIDSEKDALLESFASLGDEAISAVDSITTMVTSGTKKQGDMLKIVNEFLGKYTQAQLFKYDELIDAYTFDPSYLQEYLAILALKYADAMDVSYELAIQEVSKLTLKTLASQVDIKGFLDAENKLGLARKKLALQLKNTGIYGAGAGKYSEDYTTYLENAARELGMPEYTTEVLKRAREMAESGKKYNDQIRDNAANSFINTIEEGGKAAVDAMAAIATLSGKELTSADIESAYRAQVSQIENSFEQLITGPGGIVTGTAKTILETLLSLGKANITALDANNAVVNSITDIAAAYQEYYNLLAQSGEATLESLNNAKAKVLETKGGRDKEQKAIDTLGDAAGMTYSTLALLMTDLGIELTDDLMTSLQSTGIIESLGGAKIRIKDFAAFARAMKWDFDSEEYIDAFKSYNDGLIEYNKKIKESVIDEITGLKDVKPGDLLNLTKTEKALKKYSKSSSAYYQLMIQIHGLNDVAAQEALKMAQNDTFFKNLQSLLREYGAYLLDGILSLSENANLLGVAETLKNAAIESGSEMSAELADMVLAIVTSYTDAITKGIEGGMTNAEREDLIKKASTLGIDLKPENFLLMAEGFLLSSQAAIDLYAAMGKTDAFQKNKIYKVLSKLLKATNKSYETTTSMLARMKELSESIDELDKKKNANNEKYLDQLKNELSLMKEMYANSLSHEDLTWQFMSTDAIPDSIKNAMNYSQNWGLAMELLGLWSMKGRTDLNLFASLLKHVTELSDFAGLSLSFMGLQIGGENGLQFDDFLNRMMKAAEYNAKSGLWELNNRKLASEFGFNMNLGSKGISQEIKDLAAALAEYNLKEVEGFAQFGQGLSTVKKLLKDYTKDYGHAFEDFLDVNGDFDYSKFEQLMGKGTKAWESFEKFTDTVSINGDSYAEAMKSTNGKIKKGSEAYKAILGIIAMAMSETWDTEASYNAVAELLLASGFEGSIKLNDVTFETKGGRTIRKSDKESNWTGPNGEQFNSPEQAWDAYNLLDILNLLTLLNLYLLKASQDGKYDIQLDGATYKLSTKGGKIVDEKGKEYSSVSEWQESVYQDYVKDRKTKNKIKSNTGKGDYAQPLSYEAWQLRALLKSGANGAAAFSGKLTNAAQEAMQAAGLATPEAVKLAWDSMYAQYGEDAVYEWESKFKMKPKLAQDGKTMTDDIAKEYSDAINFDNIAASVSEGISKAFTGDETAGGIRQAISGAISDGLGGANEDGTVPIKFKGETENVPPENALDIERNVKYTATFTTPAVPTLYGTVVYKSVVSGGPKGGGGNFSVPKATGTVGLAHAKSTLMGELGPEMVVSNGKYFVVGENGPEFIDLADDAIVFNHLLTKSLFEKGMSHSRGRAVTNELAAVAYAHGNVHGGPAHAVEGRTDITNWTSMWQGPGWVDAVNGVMNGVKGAGLAVEEALDAFIKKLEEWYNQLQEIAKIEEKITYQETLRSKIESDLTKNGSAYYKSWALSMLDLNDSIEENQALYLQLEDYLSKRISALNSENSPWSKLYTLDSEGLVKYKDGMKQVFGEKFGATDANKPNYTPQEQYNWLISLGFGEFLKYDSNGKEIEFTDKEGKENQGAYKTAVESFWKTMEDELTEVQDLKDSIDEHLKAVLEALQKLNELLQEMRDNLMELENKVLDAIVESREREIDEMEKTRDVYSEYSDKLVNGLTDALNKERDMYQMQDDQAETDKMRRRLAILQSSGGSASEIIDLQELIRLRDRDMYFEEQEKQINAIKEASDLEIERMDELISLEKEVLEYQKTYGLLWQQVYDLMVKSPQEIADFIKNNTQEFWGASPVKSAEDLDDVLYSALKWLDYRDGILGDSGDSISNQVKIIADSILTNDGKKEWENFVAALNLTYGKDFTNDEELLNAYLAKYKETADPNQAAAAAKAILEARGTKTAVQEAAEAAAAALAALAAGGGGGSGGSSNTFGYAFIDANGNVQTLQGFKSKKEALDAAILEVNKQTSALAKNDEQYGGSGTLADFAYQQRTEVALAVKKNILIDTSKLTTANASALRKQVTQLNRVKAMGNAFAKGTLLGELGPEAWIANGKFHIAGQYGAEMVNLPNDAIVFNHQQTARLLRTGKAGRGNAINGEDAALGNKERNSYISTFWDLVARNRASMESINYPSYVTSSSLEHISNELQNNNTNEAITIEHAEVNMNVEQLANDYDAKRAGEQALQEMLRIARKGSATTLRR